MFYLPIIPILQRMFASMQTTSHMTWHHENQSQECYLTHMMVKPESTLIVNILLSSTPYSCWHVIVTPYSLPPEMCMSKTYMFLSCLILGPSNPKAFIDVYLKTLIDDLKKLWVGILTCDVSRKQNCMMRAF